jgi:hypothetical protein
MSANRPIEIGTVLRDLTHANRDGPRIHPDPDLMRRLSAEIARLYPLKSASCCRTATLSQDELLWLGRS